MQPLQRRQTVQSPTSWTPAAVDRVHDRQSSHSCRYGWMIMTALTAVAAPLTASDIVVQHQETALQRERVC